MQFARLWPLVFALTACALAGTLPGCAPGKRPFLIAQVCLRDPQDLQAFTREMQLIAQSDAARFIDRSADTHNELDTLGHPREGARTIPVVNMGIERGRGIGLMVSNLGLPGYEVAVGFSEGSNLADARKFAQTVVGKLEERWHVEFVPDPEKSGAFPMKNCH